MSSAFVTSGSASGSPPAAADGSKKKPKKRIRSFTPGDRACHRVIEKQRREALNESFLVSSTSAGVFFQPQHAWTVFTA